MQVANAGKFGTVDFELLYAGSPSRRVQAEDTDEGIHEYRRGPRNAHILASNWGNIVMGTNYFPLECHKRIPFQACQIDNVSVKYEGN